MKQDHSKQPLLKWKLLIATATGLVVICFVFVFIPRVDGPALFSIPFILWTGILATLLMVALTYLGARYFPYKEDQG